MGKRLYRCESFTVQGKLIRTVHKKSGRLKRLVFEDAQGIWELKCAKWCRIDVPLRPGSNLEISGLKRIKPDKIKLEVFDIKGLKTENLSREMLELADGLPLSARVAEQGPQPALSQLAPSQLAPSQAEQKSSKPCDRILVCRKKNCDRKGATHIWNALADQLNQKGDEAQVSLQSVKCLGKCKHGPVIQVLPTGLKYTQVRPEQASALLTE